MVKSISYDQQEILGWILRLYVPSGRFDVDPTYSKGVFYKNGVISEPLFKSDLYPQYDDVIQADCTALPLGDSSVDSIIFDPPFLATTGPSLSSSDDNNVINKRFGTYPSEQTLFEMYEKSLAEFHRILRPDGILVFKCQDKVSSGKQIIMHNKILNAASLSGFSCEDIFVLLAKNRIVADRQIKNQKHARKFHSYFLVFRKAKQTKRRQKKDVRTKQ